MTLQVVLKICEMNLPAIILAVMGLVAYGIYRFFTRPGKLDERAMKRAHHWYRAQQLFK